MSIETLATRIQIALEKHCVDVGVGFAFLKDVMRALHEVFTKSGRDQTSLLIQLQGFLGPAAALHLGRVIHAQQLSRSHPPPNQFNPLCVAVMTLCRERGISLAQGKALFSDFLAALDTERFDQDRNQESGIGITYWTVGPEASFHLGCLFVGDHGGEVGVEMQYLDSRLRRFRTMVDCWEMEIKWDQDQE
jgi:hypothetical protein